MDISKITTAEKLEAAHEKLSKRQRRACFQQLPDDQRYLYLRGPRSPSDFDESRVTETEEHRSPSGHFLLVVTTHRRGPNYWSYSRGCVYRQSDGARVADVRRNYSAFPFCWLEGHVDGHDYLIAGEDYQGQNFVQLDTGRVFNFLPDEAYDGFGFCWAGYELLSDRRTLLVDGCYWACPYEWRLYDVSDPSQGWPQIEWPGALGGFVDVDGTMREEGDFLIWELSEGATVEHRMVFRYQARPVELVHEWKSERLHAEATERARREREREVRHERWRQSPLFVALERHAAELAIVHFVYPSVAEREAGERNPAFFEVSVGPHDLDRDHEANMTWGVDEGPVRATCSVESTRAKEAKTFERNVEGVKSAWDWMRAHVARAP